MKNIIYILSILFITSCASSSQECETKANGFIDGVEGQVTMGEQSSVEVFNQIDKAWAELDYETLKTFVAEGAEMRFSDGRSAVGPDEFIEIIKAWVSEVEDEDGNEYTWNTDYAFSLAVTSVEGDWVNAQFTSTHTNPESKLEAEVFYEFYHIVDGKIQEWSQFKRDVLR
tara:strand:+ start:42783 stop:43295 length:513 start_codon:yes stop_codon:yes gene_type:complete